MADPLSYDAIAAKLAGIAGAVVSMRFVQGTWPERLTMAISGALFSYYAAPWVGKLTGLPEGLAGFLLGLFGMAVVSKIWEWFQTAPLGQILTDWLKKKLGGA